MKKRQYMITSGSYDDYRVVAIVEGNATPALSTLRKRFYEQYGLVNAARSSLFADALEILASVTAECRAQERARADGYEGANLGDQFLAWIIKEHGFVKVDIQEVHV